MAISFCREVARASKRFATFAQAIKRTKPTAPNSNQNQLAAAADYLFMHQVDGRTPVFGLLRILLLNVWR